MFFCFVGVEDLDLDDEGFYIGSIYDSKLNGGFKSRIGLWNFIVMLVGVEFDDEDSDGFDLGSVLVNLVKLVLVKFSGMWIVNNDG